MPDGGEPPHLKKNYGGGTRGRSQNARPQPAPSRLCIPSSLCLSGLPNMATCGETTPPDRGPRGARRPLLRCTLLGVLCIFPSATPSYPKQLTLCRPKVPLIPPPSSLLLLLPPPLPLDKAVAMTTPQASYVHLVDGERRLYGVEGVACSCW